GPVTTVAADLSSAGGRTAPPLYSIPSSRPRATPVGGGSPVAPGTTPALLYPPVPGASFSRPTGARFAARADPPLALSRKPVASGTSRRPIARCADRGPLVAPDTSQSLPQML